MMHKLRYLLVLIVLLYTILLYYVFRAQSASQYINVAAYVLPKKHVSDNVLCNRSK